MTAAIGAGTVDDAQPARRRALLWLAVAAVCWRWVLAGRTPVPAEDGVNYLWMAQAFARGDAAAALSEPFAPLWSLLLAVPIALGVEPFLAGQIAGALCGGLAVMPIAAIGERLRPGAGLPAATLATTSSLFARTATEVFTEPLFVLVAALAFWCGLQARWWRCGLLAGLAFLVRPEGALLVVPFALLQPRAALRLLVPLLLTVLAFGGWRWLCGFGFDPVPKMQFHSQRDDLGQERGDLLPNLLAAPPAFFEAFAGASLLAVLSLWPGDRSVDRRGRLAAWLLLALGIVVIALFVTRRRFFVTWTLLVLPLAGGGLLRLPRLGCKGRELLLGLVCAVDLWTAWHGTIDRDRIGERRVGEWLQQHLGPGRTVAGDLTRVRWFAGSRPLPPRHVDAAWLVAEAQAPAVEYVVLHETSGRGVFAAVDQGLRGAFVRLDLPPHLQALAAARGIAVFVRL